MPGLQFLPFLSYQGKTNREEGGGKIKLPSLPTPPPQKKKKFGLNCISAAKTQA